MKAKTQSMQRLEVDEALVAYLTSLEEEGVTTATDKLDDLARLLTGALMTQDLELIRYWSGVIEAIKIAQNSRNATSNNNGWLVLQKVITLFVWKEYELPIRRLAILRPSTLTHAIFQAVVSTKGMTSQDLDTLFSQHGQYTDVSIRHAIAKLKAFKLIEPIPQRKSDAGSTKWRCALREDDLLWSVSPLAEIKQVLDHDKSRNAA